MKLSFYLDGDCVKLNNKVKTKTEEELHARTLTNLRTLLKSFNVCVKTQCVCNNEFDY